MESTERAISSAERFVGAFEDHVLDEVRDPVLIGRLAARAGADPNAQRHGSDVRHVFGDHPDAVRRAW